MKHLIKVNAWCKSLTFVWTVMIALPNSYASTTNLSFSPQRRFFEVSQLQQAGHTQQAAHLAAETVSDLYDALKPGTIVASITSHLKEVRKEIITEHVDRSSEKNGLVAIFQMLFPIHLWERESYDVTKIVTLNPMEVAQFPAKVQKDLLDLKGQVRSYLLVHIEELFYIKYFSMMYFRMVSQASAPLEVTSKNLFELVKKQTQTLTFGGQQQITACIETQYANHKSSTERGVEIGFSGLLGWLMPFELGQSESVQHRYFSHTENSCKSSINEIWDSQWPVNKLNLTELDWALKGWLDQAELTLQLQTQSHQQSPGFPTWGSPYL